jgi:hypothetical protein
MTEHRGVAEGVALLELHSLGRGEHVLDRSPPPRSDSDVETTFFARFSRDCGLRGL